MLLGEPFGCLQARATHKYVGLIFTMLESFPILYTITYYPWAKYVGVLLGFIDIGILRRRRDFALWIYDKAVARAERETSRPDFYSHILANNGTKEKDGRVMSISQDEINSNCLLFIAAGSETTATLLSGATYLLLKNPSTHAILKDEIRSAFQSYDSITIDSISSLPYLLAVLSESLRYFPPVATGFPRQTPPAGATISGHYIPAKTSVYVSSYPAGHSTRNFRDPEVFAPERWMGDPKYADDKRNALQPFSFGPRNCLGKNLAHAEMRLILAKMIWSFDMELDPRSENWMDECKIFTLWKKPELAVRVREAVRD